jgi:hypothetical protein
MQTPAQNSEAPLLSALPVVKTSKHVTDKLSSIEARLCRLEEEFRVVTSSEKDARQRQQKILDENKELLKQNETLDCKVGELREEVDTQKKTLASIHTMLENLKTNGGVAAKAVVKAEKAVCDNAWNVSRHGSVMVSADEPVSRVVLAKPSSGLWVYSMQTKSRMSYLLVQVTTSCKTLRLGRTFYAHIGRVTSHLIANGTRQQSTSLDRRVPTSIRHSPKPH